MIRPRIKIWIIDQFQLAYFGSRVPISRAPRHSKYIQFSVHLSCMGAWPKQTHTFSIIHYRTKRCVYLKESAQCSHMCEPCRFFGHTSVRFARRVAISICPPSDYSAYFSRLIQNGQQPARCVCNFMYFFAPFFLFFIAPSLSLQQVADSLHIPLPYICISLFTEQGPAHWVSAYEAATEKISKMWGLEWGHGGTYIIRYHIIYLNFHHLIEGEARAMK